MKSFRLSMGHEKSSTPPNSLSKMRKVSETLVSAVTALSIVYLVIGLILPLFIVVVLGALAPILPSWILCSMFKIIASREKWFDKMGSGFIWVNVVVSSATLIPYSYLLLTEIGESLIWFILPLNFALLAFSYMWLFQLIKRNGAKPTV